jgi:hypothetical protein
MKMSTQRELRKQGIQLLFDRVKLLVEIETDPEFVVWCEEMGVAVFDALDEELTDVACEYLTLRAVMDAHPAVGDWRKGDLRQLIAATLQKDKRERTRETPSWKERCLAAEKECERLRGEVNTLRARLTELQSALQVTSGGKYRDTPVAAEMA